MFRRAFTLIELLVVVVILGVMVTVGVISVESGKREAAIRGAARDVFAAVRRARSTALVTQQPAVVTFSNEFSEDEGVRAKVEISSAKIFDDSEEESEPETLSGEPLKSSYKLVNIREAKTKKGHGASDGEEGASALSAGGGKTIEDVLFAPVPGEVMSGMRLKVVKDELGYDDDVGDNTHRPKISVFSNVDYLLGRYQDSRKRQEAEAAKKTDKGEKPASADDEMPEPVSVVWEVNGRTEPHRIWVYADGEKPEDGLLIRVDRFGGMKVVDGQEDD